MNRMDKGPDGLAELEYLDGEIRVVTPGAFVVCAVTAVQIPIDSLRYWSVDLQEPYATPGAALQRFQEKGMVPK